MVNNPIQSNPQFQGSQNKKQKQSFDPFGPGYNAGKSNRLFIAGLPNGAEPDKPNSTLAVFNTSGQGLDWRVRISVPEVGTFRSSRLLSPLQETENNVVFPITPSISLIHTANYDGFDPVHNNYTFPQYVNSRIEDIAIAAPFPVQNEIDGRYWVAATHFFRSATKMFYGETSNKGAPPPVCKLNGYGDYVLKNIPVVITSFSLELPNNVDYIKVPVEQESNGISQIRETMVPTLSNLTITVKPVYSRSKVEQFSLDKFVNGELIDQGFI